MISNLNPELSQQVVRAVHNRLRQALNMSAVPETATAVPESGPAVPEAAAAVPETAEVNADAPGMVHSPTHGDGERERSRSPRAGVPPAEDETEKNKDLKEQIVQELLASLLAICPTVTPEEATPAKLLQSNLSLGVATVGLTEENAGNGEVYGRVQLRLGKNSYGYDGLHWKPGWGSGV